MNTNKILRNSIIAGIFLLPFVCLIVSNHFFFPFITGKNFAFRIIVEIIFGLWMILAFRDTSFAPKSSRLLQVFALFAGVIFISNLFSPNVFKSFWSNYERMEGWVTLIHLLALFMVASSVMTRKLWEWLFRTSVGVSLIIFVYGCFQLAGKLDIHQGGVRLDATFGNATYLAIYMLFHIFFNLLLLASVKKNSVWAWVYGFAILAEGFILYHTATRGAILGLIGGISLSAILVLIFYRENKLVKQSAVGLLVGILVLLGVFFASKNTEYVKNNPILGRFSSLSFSDKTAESRFMIWNMAVLGFKERPILGWGQESFNYVFNKYYDPKMYSQEQWFDRTHNVFFDWLIAGGLLGIISYLSLFGFALYYLWRKGDNFSILEKSIITGLLAGYFFHNLTVFDNITSYILFIFTLAWIDSCSNNRVSVITKKIGTVDVSVRDRIVIPVVAVVIIFAIYKVNVPSMLAASELITALSAQPGGPTANLEHYKRAFDYEGLGDSEIREQLIQTTMQAVNAPTVDPNVKQSFFDLSKKQIEIQLKRTPEDARYFLFGGSLFAGFGDLDNAIKTLTRAKEISPKKQTILFSLGSAYLGKGDTTTAVAIMKEAFELDQTFDEARKIYALALIYDKKITVAEELLKPLKAEAVLSDERLLGAYFRSGYLERALAIVNFLIQQNPNNPTHYYSRATVQVALGRRTSAIADLRKIAEINPTVKDDIEKLVARVRDGQGL